VGCILVQSNSLSVVHVHLQTSFDKSHEEDAHRCEIREKFKRLDTTFYQCDALKLAPRLLGKYLSKDDIILQITEV
jgi:hypothetical protein